MNRVRRAILFLLMVASGLTVALLLAGVTLNEIVYLIQIPKLF